MIQRGFDLVRPGGTTAFYASVVTAIDALRASVNRRRAVVMISDGNDFMLSDMASPGDAFDRRSRALERVQRSEAMVYAIGIDAPLPGPVTPDKAFDANALRTLTEPTGGTTVIARSSDAIPSAAQAIVDDLRQQYVLGFEPAHTDDGKFHRLTVRVLNCDCRVRARRGYVATAVK